MKLLKQWSNKITFDLGLKFQIKVSLAGLHISRITSNLGFKFGARRLHIKTLI